MTNRQRDVLYTIVDLTWHDGRPPTLREIGDRLGIRSTNGVNDHLKALERDGFIERTPMISRSIRVLKRADGTDLVCPCCRQAIVGNEPVAGEVGTA